MMDVIIAWLEQTVQSVPLPLFAIVGGIVEEIIAPIPSPMVSTLAGGIIVSQGLGFPYLLFICAIATAAKTFGAWIFYVIGDKLEDVAVPKFGKYIGVSQQDIERFSGYLHGSHKDILILTLLRSIPVMPSTPISVLCGMLKMRNATFWAATFIGFYVRNLFFMLIGYSGLQSLESLMQGIDMAETALKIGIVGAVVAVLGWLYWRRSRGKSLAFLQRLNGSATQHEER